MKKYIWGAVAAAVVIVVVLLKSDAACSYFPSQIAWINECKTVNSLTPIASDEANKPVEVTPITIEPVTEELVMDDENKDAKTVETPEAVASEEPAIENSADENATNDTSTNETSTSENPAKADEVIKPTFDLARVEADGSAVVAGRAIPNATIILKNSGEIIAQTTTNATGEWVAIVEMPVSDDVIELTVDSIAKDGVVTSSDEEIKIAMRKIAPAETTVTETPVIKAAEETAVVETSEVETPVAETETVETAVVETSVAVITPTGNATVATSEVETPVVVETSTEEPKLEIKIASVNSDTPTVVAQETSVVETPIAVAKTDEPKIEVKVAAVEATTTEVVAEEIAIEETTEVDNTPLVVLTKKGEATKVLQGAGVGTKGNEMTFNSLDYNENGQVIFSGDAKANEFVRVYINNQFIGQTKSDETGRWSLDVGYVMKSGKNDMRFDQVDASGAVISRRVTTITMPKLEQKTPQNSTVADNTQKDVVKTDETQIVVEVKPKNTRAVIVWGDSLWNISQEIYGDGELYIAIFEANKRQIRNPDLIFPGQVFMLPDDEEIEVIMAPLRG